MEYETEEQQLEAIKKWWKENSSVVIMGVAIGITAIAGWQFYQTSRLNHMENASVLYEQTLMQSDNPDKMSDQLATVNQLKAEFDDTPYASLAALITAKQQLAKGSTEKAEQLYRWVVENATQDEIKYLAKTRLARLLLTLEKPDEALKLLNEPYPSSYEAMVLELKGDVLLIQGNKTAARQAYVKANILSMGGNHWLKLKIDDLGDAIPKAESALDKTIENKPAA